MGKTAAELMAELAEDKEFQAKKKARDAYFLNLEKKYSEDEKLLVKSLNEKGFAVSSVWDLVNSKNDYFEAQPILISHLKTQHHPKTLAGIARSLAVPEFSGNDELWNLLSELYEKTPPNSEIEVPEERGMQEAIAVALECLTTPSRTSKLEKLIAMTPNGDGIHWLKERLKDL